MSEKTLGRTKYNMNSYRFIRNRELGIKRKLGHDDNLCKKMYCNMDAYVPDVPPEKGITDSGAIFNLEFSLDGKLLVAACEDNAVMLLDSVNQRVVHRVSKAHDRCVNCVKFLDPETFATCSDDGTVKIWDTRRLNSSVKVLAGHSNWVKNVGYSQKEQVLITSAFDGSIYYWNVHEPEPQYCKAFVMSGLMRTKLTPDGSKLVIATTSGYIIVIHDLNLETLEEDTKSFRPNLYRLMQLSGQCFPTATMYNYLFRTTRKRNRFEIIDDFPNDAEVVSSIEVHPHGWSALTRNVSSDDDDEFTCVHDIQLRDDKEYEEAVMYVEEPKTDVDHENLEGDDGERQLPNDIWVGFMTNSNHINSRNYFDSLSTERSYMGVVNSGLIGSARYDRYFKLPQERNKIVKPLHRLTHYIQDSNEGKGYIKEQCFSADGRVACSPYDKGVRLLGFNEELQELSHCVPDKPRPLYPLAVYKDYHSDVVVCCKFNPVHYQFVSGCLGGKIVWYRPIL